MGIISGSIWGSFKGWDHFGIISGVVQDSAYEGLRSLIYRSCLSVWLAPEEIKRSKEFFSHSTMSSSTFFVVGRIHQGQEQLSDKSQERQCSFMSFSALLCAQTLSIES